MLRALVKGAGLVAVARVPGGAAAYRRLTRDVLGTQRGHVEKLRRVVPGYVEIWRQTLERPLEGARIWIHEAGWTAYWPAVCYRLSGRAGAVTNCEGRIHDQYLSRAIAGAIATEIPNDLNDPRRIRRLRALLWARQSDELFRTLEGTLHERCVPTNLPLADASRDLCHSGGVLEHYRPDELAAFARECRRVLKPGAIASHVLDHRDHLWHADKAYPFLGHLALAEPLYQLLHGHRRSLSYHNRLSPEEVVALFEREGFRCLALRRLVLPERIYLDADEAARRGAPGLSRRYLAPRHRAISEADLRTAAAHYLFQKS
ncbi:MAG: class I SAM-dependent methyltransferase [Myxococcales bacterium]|nr:class I SAM-dependent methyltransferase [Myxococcales bacterium]